MTRAAAIARIAYGSGRFPVRRPPQLKPGEVMRVLKRQHSEDYDGALSRARALSWWPKATHLWPYSTATSWIWVVQP